MFVLVLAAEADETRQAVTLLIVCLIGIAFMLSLLTVWYWLYTSPKRRSERLLADLGHFDPEAGEWAGADEASQPPPPVLATAKADDTPAQAAAITAEVAAPVAKPEPSKPKLENLLSSLLAEREPMATSSEMAPSSEVAPSSEMDSAKAADTPDSTEPTRSASKPAHDELARARQRRAKRVGKSAKQGASTGASPGASSGASTGEGLSDDDWAAVMKSAFNQLNR